MEDIILAATFLNPKFKELLFNNVQTEIAKKFITDLIVSKKENNAIAENAVADVEVTLNRPTPVIAENDAHGSGLLKSAFAKINNLKERQNLNMALIGPEELIAQEFNQYTMEPTQSEEQCTLDYWKQNQTSFPLMSIAAA